MNPLKFLALVFTLVLSFQLSMQKAKASYPSKAQEQMTVPSPSL